MEYSNEKKSNNSTRSKSEVHHWIGKSGLKPGDTKFLDELDKASEQGVKLRHSEFSKSQFDGDKLERTQPI